MKLGIYKHYKGKKYEVLGIVLHTETDEKLVLYKALYDSPNLQDDFGIRPMFVRPYEMFFESVIIEGKEVKRFDYIN